MNSSLRVWQCAAGLACACLLATAALAQNSVDTTQPATGSSAAASASSTASTPGGSAQPAKKVWTNEDVGELRDHNEMSTFAVAKTRPSAPAAKAPANRGRNAKWYHDQIANLQAKVSPIDSQIAALQNALDGRPTGDGKTSARPAGVRADSWALEKADLEKKRQGILDQIDALHDEARHNGIPDGALP